jgi:phage terminase large subunit
LIHNTQTKNSDAFWVNYNDLDINYLVLEGGTSSSKTFSAVFCFILLASMVKFDSPILISFIAESVPKLKVGMMRDFRLIMADSWHKDEWNATDRVYTFPDTGNQIEFLNADDEERVKGPRRDMCLIDEGNHLSYNVARQVFVRTRGFKVITHNPTSEYWAHSELQSRKDCAWVHSTFLDALHVIPEQTTREIIAQKDKDPNWWRVYGLGLIGNIEGLCHPYFSVTQDIPDGGARVFGIDFGFGGDPCCLTENVVIGDNLYSDQLIYEKGLLNSQLAARFASLGIRKHYDEIYADSAEPKSIAELCAYGYNVKACPKGADSVVHGIQFVNRYRQHWTTRSLECIKEQRNYRYIEDRDGRLTEKPMDDYNHGMDSRRYAIVGKFAQNSTARAGRVFL